MPMYAYACKDCGHAFDIQQSFSDDSLTVCPECSGILRKKFNSVGVVFKGSGFYRNDSRPKEGAGVNGSSKDSNGDTRADKPEKTSSNGSDSGTNGNGGATKKEPAASSAAKGSSSASGTALSTGSSSSS